MKQFIVEDWREAWSWFSVHVGAIAVIFGALPAETQAGILGLFGIPPSAAVGVVGVLVIVARLVHQGPQPPVVTDATD